MAVPNRSPPSGKACSDGHAGYQDPYAGEGYDLPADLILVTHGHQDHTAVDLIRNRSDDCRIITYKEALEDGEYKTFDLGYAIVEAVQAGNNKNHDTNACVGWLLRRTSAAMERVTTSTRAWAGS